MRSPPLEKGDKGGFLIENCLLLQESPLTPLYQRGVVNHSLPTNLSHPMKIHALQTTLVLCLLWMTACANQRGVEVGQVAPEFTLRNLRGGELSLSAFRGKVVLINFWATWCGPCKAEMPSMETLYKSYKRDDFEIIAVSIDTVGENTVRDFVERFHLTFPVVLDNQFVVNQLYEARYVPTSLLIDRKGIIRDKIPGAKNWNDKETRLLVDKLIQLR